jgi:beta-galactosidase
MPVPGSWGKGTWKGKLPGLARSGEGEQWKDAEESSQGWYERGVVVPAGWKGRSVVLDISRVSTDAVVELNGVKCGQIAWPRGTVDVTRAVKFGEPNTLRVRVLAVTTSDAVPNFMGTVDSQVTFQKATLDSRGITGDVVLYSRPSGAHVSDVFVQTSTRKKQLTVSVELADVRQKGTVQLEAQLFDEKGKLEKSFTQGGISVTPGAAQTVSATWPWPTCGFFGITPRRSCGQRPPTSSVGRTTRDLWVPLTISRPITAPPGRAGRVSPPSRSMIRRGWY